ncbi:Trypanosomal VSG domain [Trypanosoma vivax]|nr:Trypanosomal VSG domain [Trypanosoma vivax]
MKEVIIAVLLVSTATAVDRALGATKPGDSAADFDKVCNVFVAGNRAAATAERLSKDIAAIWGEVEQARQAQRANALDIAKGNTRTEESTAEKALSALVEEAKTRAANVKRHAMRAIFGAKGEDNHNKDRLTLEADVEEDSNTLLAKDRSTEDTSFKDGHAGKALTVTMLWLCNADSTGTSNKCGESSANTCPCAMTNDEANSATLQTYGKAVGDSWTLMKASMGGPGDGTAAMKNWRIARPICIARHTTKLDDMNKTNITSTEIFAALSSINAAMHPDKGLGGTATTGYGAQCLGQDLTAHGCDGSDNQGVACACFPPEARKDGLIIWARDMREAAKELRSLEEDKIHAAQLAHHIAATHHLTLLLAQAQRDSAQHAPTDPDNETQADVADTASPGSTAQHETNSAHENTARDKAPQRKDAQTKNTKGTNNAARENKARALATAATALLAQRNLAVTHNV